MNLEALKGRKVVLFGKPRSLNADEFDRLLKTAGIVRAAAWSPDTAVVVEGRMPAPHEQDELDRLYEAQAILPVGIDTFEKALCSQLDADRILMSLKLTADRDRLRAFLQNPHIGDTFFLRLLALYDWGGEGFFDNDANRDVTAAFISRFYDNLERNHNIQYSTLGLLHLLQNDVEASVVHTLGRLDPMRRAFSDADRQLRSVIEALARHPHTDTHILREIIRRGDDALRAVVAQRPKLDAAVQQELFALGNPAVTLALAQNPDLDDALMPTFGEDPALAPVLFANLHLDAERFAQGLAAHPETLAGNPTLDRHMQRTLIECGDVGILRTLAANENLCLAENLLATEDTGVLTALAANPAVPADVLERLDRTGGFDEALAANPSLDAGIIETLFHKKNAAVLAALAANPSTPVQILQQLQLDARFERIVRQNETFSEHVKREQIGWL